MQVPALIINAGTCISVVVCLYQQESIILYQNFVSVNCLYMSRDLAEKSLKEENNSEEHPASYYFRTASA